MGGPETTVRILANLEPRGPTCSNNVKKNVYGFGIGSLGLGELSYNYSRLLAMGVGATTVTDIPLRQLPLWGVSWSHVLSGTTVEEGLGLRVLVAEYSPLLKYLLHSFFEMFQRLPTCFAKSSTTP